jgi:tetratricopeptide (TPR) repeat protein
MYAVGVANSERIAELRRRVEADPASRVFGQLAEEYRRVGDYDKAIACCRAGLGHHPDDLDARVTLGRSLLELGQLDQAAEELGSVLQSAPDNVPALRAMSEIHQRRGALDSALEHCRRALALARFDADIPEHATIAPGHEQARASRPPMVDFDSLLASMGMPDAPPPPSIERLVSGGDVPAVILPDAPVEPAADDPFGWVERELRTFDQRRDVRRDDAVLAELETWLAALQATRRRAQPRRR